mmetsp:Transcript_6150/g.9189  ORF Transcript_6150/g.9189 Transcript_6150/m.9189 type:complete len:80 (+) Transcript_6150:194-433(+)
MGNNMLNIWFILWFYGESLPSEVRYSNSGKERQKCECREDIVELDMQQHYETYDHIGCAIDNGVLYLHRQAHKGAEKYK